jgi:hypothetical protein
MDGTTTIKMSVVAKAVMLCCKIAHSKIIFDMDEEPDKLKNYPLSPSKLSLYISRFDTTTLQLKPFCK